MSKLKIVYKHVDEIIPYVNNPRKISQNAIDKVASSIKNFGFKVPIIIDKDNEIVAGHNRILAAKKLGMEEVPCIVVDDLTEAQIKAFRIADNKTAEFAEWDFELLEMELEGIEEEFTGFDPEELEKIFLKETEVEEENFIENLVETRVKQGELWALGNHRLFCGDAFKEEHIKKLMNGVKADLVILDPPFDMEEDEWINNLKFSKKGCPTFLMASDKQTIKLANKIPNFRHFLVHDRVSAVMLNSNMPMSRHTIISFFCEHPGKYFRNLKDYFTTIIELNRNYKNNEENLGSKMGKPTEIPKKLIEHYSKEEDIVLSLFGGGGSDLIASEMLNRSCYINEILPEQCDIIISRWEQYTNKKSTKIS